MPVYFDNEADFKKAAIQSPNAIIIVFDSSYLEGDTKLLYLNNAKAKRLSCFIKNKLKQSGKDASSLKTSNKNYPDLVNEISIRMEIGGNYAVSESLREVADGVNRYFK